VRVVHAEQLTALDPAEAVRPHRVVVVSGRYLADDATLDWLVAYAAAGGHLVLGPRTGYGDPEGRARAEVAPTRLREAPCPTRRSARP
jgi:beta-galactosidase